MDTATIHVSGPAALAASVPGLLGFTPAEGDGVVIGCAGRRVVMSARVALRRGALDTIATSVAGALRRGAPGVDRVHVVTYGPDRHLPHDLLGAMWRAGCGGGEALRVDAGRVFVGYTDTVGELLPADAVAAAAVLTSGQVTAASREEKATWLDRRPNLPPADATRRLGRILADLVTRDQRLGMLAEMTGEDLGEELGLALRAVQTYGTDDVLTYAAIVAYLLGDGALASMALDRTSGGYSLAALIRSALAAPVPPTTLRAWLKAAAQG